MKNYETIEEFAKRIGKSRRTIFRFYSDNRDLQAETKKNGLKKIIPISHKKYFSTDELFEDNKQQREENRMMSNLLNYLYKNDNPMAIKLWRMDWSLFVTIDYKYERNKIACFTLMHKFYDEIEKKYGKDSTLRMFFVTEPFANRNNGQHNHFIFYIENEVLKPLIIHDINKFFKNDRVVTDNYSNKKGGTFYILKE